MWILKPSFLRITALKCCQNSLNRDPNAFLWRLPLTFELWPTLRLLPLLQEGGDHPRYTRICFSILFINNSSEGKASPAGLRPINKETYSQISRNQPDTNSECSNSIWSRTLEQHLFAGESALCSIWYSSRELWPLEMYAHDMTKNTRKVKRRGKNRKQQQMSLSE